MSWWAAMRNFLAACEKESEVRSENDSEEEETYLALIVSILELLECGE